MFIIVFVYFCIIFPPFVVTFQLHFFQAAFLFLFRFCRIYHHLLRLFYSSLFISATISPFPSFFLKFNCLASFVYHSIRHKWCFDITNSQLISRFYCLGPPLFPLYIVELFLFFLSIPLLLPKL